MKLRSTQHCTYNINYHFVWCLKYRKPILINDIAEFLDKEIKRLATNNNWEVISLNIQPDHVHLFISAKPRFSPSQIANTLKGITAREIFKLFPKIKKELWGGHFWSRSFYVQTAGALSEDSIRRYVELCQD